MEKPIVKITSRIIGAYTRMLLLRDSRSTLATNCSATVISDGFFRILSCINDNLPKQFIFVWCFP